MEYPPQRDSDNPKDLAFPPVVNGDCCDVGECVKYMDKAFVIVKNILYSVLLLSYLRILLLLW